MTQHIQNPKAASLERPATRVFFTLVLCSLAAAFLAGCSVKPVPLTPEEHKERIVEDKKSLYKDQESLTGPLTLHEAIARALKYNYDHRLALMETVLQDRQLGLTSLNMLPRLAANAGYTMRSNELASESISYETRRISLEPSISSDRYRGTGDLSLSWNVLDFGVSYFQARQQADRILISAERRRRVVNNIVKEVQAAYWRAATAERLLPLLGPALADAEKALRTYEQIEAERLQPLLPTLEQQKALLQIINQLKKLQSDLSVSKSQLAALINVPIGTEYTVAEVAPDTAAPPLLSIPLERMELIGLYYRPDLREEAYQERVDLNGVKREMIRLLPGATLLSSYNYDSNSFLVHNFWAEAGARLSFNLINLLTWERQLAPAEAQVEVSRTRRKALTVAALVQINISYHQYRRAVENYENALSVSRIEDRILKAVGDAASVDAKSELERVRRAASAISAQLDRDRGLADLYAALANIYFSLGIAPYTGPTENLDVPTLAEMIRGSLREWQQGWLPGLPGEQPQDPPHVPADPAPASAPTAAAPTGEAPAAAGEGA